MLSEQRVLVDELTAARDRERDRNSELEASYHSKLQMLQDKLESERWRASEDLRIHAENADATRRKLLAALRDAESAAEEQRRELSAQLDALLHHSQQEAAQQMAELQAKLEQRQREMKEVHAAEGDGMQKVRQQQRGLCVVHGW